jgi:hypothetical protein
METQCADPKLFELVLRTALEFKLKSKRQMFGGERHEQPSHEKTSCCENMYAELKKIETCKDTTSKKEYVDDAVVDFNSDDDIIKEKTKRRRIEVKKGNIMCDGCNVIFSARSNLGRHWKSSYEKNPDGDCARYYSRKKISNF